MVVVRALDQIADRKAPRLPRCPATRCGKLAVTGWAAFERTVVIAGRHRGPFSRKPSSRAVLARAVLARAAIARAAIDLVEMLDWLRPRIRRP